MNGGIAILLVGAFFCHDEKVPQVHEEERPHHDPFRKGDGSAGQSADQHNHGDGHHERHLIFQCGFLHRHVSDQRRNPQNNKYVQNVASHHVSDGDAGILLQCCGNAHRRFRHAGAHGHDGQSDDQLRNAQPLRNAC